MSKLIKNLEKISPDEEILEGSFKSLIFKGEDDTDELSVYIENPSCVDYAEECIKHFNSMPDDMIDGICEGILESCHSADDEDCEIPELENVRDILNYCWFTSLSTYDENGISYVVEGEGDWGEAVGFVVRDGKVTYIGDDFYNRI